MSADGKSDTFGPQGQHFSDAVPDELRHALQSIACLSGILFLLPLSLLVARPPSMTEACGWAGDSLDSRCAIALALLWFGLMASVAQLVMLSAASSAGRFIQRLWWHLPATVLSTLLGGAIGMHALGLHLSLVRGNCEAEWHSLHILLIVAVAAGYLIFVVYAYVLRHDSKLARSLDSPKMQRQQSPVDRYGPDLERQADDSHALEKGERPVAISVIPSASKSGGSNTGGRESISGKLFNVSGDTSHRSSRDISTAVPSQIHTPAQSSTPSERADAGSSSNGSSNNSKGQNYKLDAVPMVLEEAFQEEELQAVCFPTHNQAISAASFSGEPLYGGSQSSSNTWESHHGADPLKPALSSFGVAKRDGRVSIKTDESVISSHRRGSGRSRRSSGGESRRSSAGGRSRRGSAEGGRSRRGSAEGGRSRRGSTERRGSQDPVAPPAPTPFDAQEQLQGQIEYALAERRWSLAKLDKVSEDKTSSRNSSVDGNAFTDIEEAKKDDGTSVKKKKGESSKLKKPEPAFPGEPDAEFRYESPINFDKLTVAQDSDSASGSDSGSCDSDCRSDETETWNTGASAKVEVPIWLLEKLKARGWEPPEEEVAASAKKDPLALPPSTDSKSRPASPGRFASCPDLGEDDEADTTPKKSWGPMVLYSGSSDATFWKIPMPTRKNTMMIQPGKGRKTMEEEDDEEDEDKDDDDDDDDELAEDARTEWRMSLVNADGEVEDLTSTDRSSSPVKDPRRCASGPSSRLSSICSNSSTRSGGILKSNGDWQSGGVKPFMTRRKISFMDQELGQSFEKYSEEKKKRGIGSLDGISEDVGSQMKMGFKMISPPSWKKPSRSRANSVQVFPEIQEVQSGLNSGNFVFQKAGQAGQAGEGGSEGDGSLAVPDGCRRSRRPSLLAIFSDDNAKSPGLYAVPKEKDPAEPTSELVEIRRGSLVMSSSMLTDILKSKTVNGEDRLDDIEEGQMPDSEVILPFFSQAQQHIRNCQCQVDPETGNVIHTCMTPSATQTTNSVFQSYICSEWGTRRNSADKEARRAKSRKSSEDFEPEDSDADNEADDIVMPPPPPVENPRPPSRKRIRNASVLAMCNRPLPATKTEVEEEPAQENELAISFKNIQSVEDSCLSDSSPETPEKRRSTLPKKDEEGKKHSQATGEARVETELTHKFELLEPYIMAGMLKDPECREHLLVVDVRGRDWVGGHIPSSINLRTSEVVAHPEALLSQVRQNKITHLVFTCMYSVLRARKCAVAVEKSQSDYLKAGNNAPKIRLSLLAGGMHAWVNHFMKSQTDKPPKFFLDGFDPEMWSDGGPSQGGLVHVMDALWSSGGQKALSDALTQELEQLVLMRRNSQELSRRESHSSRRNSEIPAEARIVDAAADEAEDDFTA